MGRKTGRSKGYVKCWNCDGYIGKELLDDNHHADVCPLCLAIDLIDNDPNAE
jgi:Zn finger protein HypA/HybF involved in hydrogenase expression